MRDWQVNNIPVAQLSLQQINLYLGCPLFTDKITGGYLTVEQTNNLHERLRIELVARSLK